MGPANSLAAGGGSWMPWSPGKKPRRSRSAPSRARVEPPWDFSVCAGQILLQHAILLLMAYRTRKDPAVTPRSAPSRRPFCESGGDASREPVRARRPTGQPGADDSTRPHSAKQSAAGRPGSVAARRRPVAVLPRAAAVGHCERDSRLEAWRPHSFGPCRSRLSGYRETACSLTEATRRPALGRRISRAEAGYVPVQFYLAELIT
jgi:hypothetical protein